MLNRRIFITTIATAIVLGSNAIAQSAPVTMNDLKTTFEQRPMDFRRMAQQGLQGEGYYKGQIDGSWGPGTEKAYEALMASPRYRRHAPGWTWAKEVQIVETLLFLNSDSYP